MLLFFASLRVLRELRVNQLALRSLRGNRQHRCSREVREDREGPRITATPGVVSQPVQVKTHIWIAKQGLPPPPRYSDAAFEPMPLVFL